MNPAMIKGIVAGVVIATAGGAIAAGYRQADPADQAIAEVTNELPMEVAPQFAEVKSVVPLIETVSNQREVCEEVPVTVQAQPRDQHKIAGTATGALVGGLLGNQIGGGSGKKIATVVGTAAGAFAGNKIQERAQANDVVTKMERQCHMVTDLSERVSGYDVTYMIGAVEGNVRMQQKPGERIPLDNGELAIN